MSQVNQLEISDDLNPRSMLVERDRVILELCRARDTGLMSIDTETTSLMEYELRILGFSFAYFDQDSSVVSWYVPLTHTEGLNAPIQVLDDLKEILIDQSVKIVMHNAKFDLQVLQKYGLNLGLIASGDNSRIEDTMIMAHLIDENRRSVGLKQLSLSELDYRQQTLEEIVGKDFDMTSLSSHRAAQYAADDAGCTLLLYRKFKVKIEEFGLTQVYEKIEQPLILVLSDMAKNGVRVDVGLVNRLDEVCQVKSFEYQERVYSTMGSRINLNSPKQLGEFLYDRMGLPVLNRTKGGGRSCDAATLEQLENRGNPIAGDIMKYRWFTKMKGTFLSGLMPVHDGKVFPQFHQAGTVTGRLSSSNPNMQNYPAESDLGVRACVIPYDGDVMGCADYSQIELRLAAHFSKDKGMMEGFYQGADIHQWTADLMHIERRHAKTINFGILYGMYAGSLAENLGVDKRQAQEYIDGWFNTYLGIQDFKRWAESFVSSKGYVTTLSGRRRNLPDVHSSEWSKRGYALRQALNSIVQGSGADLLKYSMVKIADKYKQKSPVRIFSNVHDELLFSFRADIAEEVAADCKYIMENSVKLEVPVVVDMAIGKNWWISKYQSDVDSGKVVIPEHIRGVC